MGRVSEAVKPIRAAPLERGFTKTLTEPVARALPCPPQSGWRKETLLRKPFQR